MVVDYRDLVGDPAATVRSIYERFGFELDPAFAKTLEARSVSAAGYRSQHRYALDRLGLDQEAIVEDFRDVFDRFGFPTEDAGR
jgi:hypothetical protein